MADFIISILLLNKLSTQFFKFLLLPRISITQNKDWRNVCWQFFPLMLSLWIELFIHAVPFLHFLLFGISGNLRRLRSVPPLPGRFDGTCSGVGQELKLEHESPTSLTTLSRPPLPDTVVPPPPGPGPPPPTDRPLLLSPPNRLMSSKDSRIVS